MAPHYLLTIGKNSSLFVFVIFLLLPYMSYGQETTVDDLKKMSLEELMNIEVISISRRPEKLWQTPSAIQVLKGDDIGKYGASNIPEALFLAGNLQVTQKGSNGYGISARGFNTDLANKLLVLIDGRTIYTPLYSGVFWDRQDYLLNDIDQVEVVSGPGGTLWGANAVNGVINITTKNAGDTQGLFAEAGVGNELKTIANVRYGGKIAPRIFYRVYGKFGDRDQSVYPDSVGAQDAWQMAQGGFRIDGAISDKSKYTLQGDLYNNKVDQVTGNTAEVTGGNVLGRWDHTFSENSELRVQAYYDRTKLYAPTGAFVANGLELAPAGVFKDDLTTYDIELQHRIKLGGRNQMVWGGGYRLMRDETTNSPALGFLPEDFDQSLSNLFVQDEFQLLKNLSITAGTKLEHNAYTGYVWEPSGRIRLSLNEHRIVWASVSRALRTPSRIDRQLTQGTPPYFVLLKGSEDFISETLVATELGFRTQLSNQATISIATYYNQYDDVRSTVLDPVTIFPLSFQNGLEGETYGMELSLTYQVNDRWQLASSYNLLREDIRIKEGKADFNNALNETADPGFQFTFRSALQLPKGFSVNGAFRWIDALPINNAGILAITPAYAELDGQVAWKASDHVTLAMSGRNLLHKEHTEYGIPGNNLRAIQRSVYGKITVRLGH